MKSAKYLQIENMFLESGINFFKSSKEETLKIYKYYAPNLPESIRNIILEVIGDIYDSVKNEENAVRFIVDT